jgi:hypothetical protein
MRQYLSVLVAVLLTTPLIAENKIWLNISARSSSESRVVVSCSGVFTTQPYYVLYSSTNLVNWTPISTNALPVWGSGGSATNVIQTTNASTFYKAKFGPI